MQRHSHRIRRRAVATLSATALLMPTAARAQLSLRDALHIADQSAFANRAAAGATAAQRGQTIAPLQGIIPALHLESGYIRTTDPIGTFGATLRQRTITTNDFDPARLNYPSAVGNYQASVVVEQPLINADAWIGAKAARRALDATNAQEEWTTRSTRSDVIRAYYGAVVAAERVATLTVASTAAHAHARQAESMVRNGLATKSDALLASVRAGEVDVQLAEARGGADIAARQLALALGQNGPSRPTLPQALPSSAHIEQIAAADTGEAQPRDRLDVDAAQAAAQAAQNDADRARSAYLPRLNAFARYDWNSAAHLYAGDKNWSVGVMASWSPFASASVISDNKTASGRAAQAAAQADAASARAAADAERTRTMLNVALTRLDIAEHSLSQSAEAHRIVSRKYEGGVATIAELLDAQAAETQTALALSDARFGVIAALADRRLALGRDPGSLVALEDATAVTATRSPSDSTSRY